MAAILTLPFDVVKTQRQVALGAVEAVRGEGPGWRGVRGSGGPGGVLLGRALCQQCRPRTPTLPGYCCRGSGPSLAPGDSLQVGVCVCVQALVGSGPLGPDL